MSALVADQRLEARRFEVKPLLERYDGFAYWCLAGEAKYGEPFWEAEFRKIALRQKWAQEPNPGFGEAEAYFARAKAFWAEYEEINRVWIPEDPVFSSPKTGTAMATANSTWQFLAAASGQMRKIEFFAAGEAAASAVLRIAVQRSAIGTGTTPATVTPEKANTRSAAAATTVYGAVSANVAWGTTQETLAGNPFWTPTFNAFGGSSRIVPPPGAEFYLVNGEYSSVRSLSGTSTISGHVIFEEL